MKPINKQACYLFLAIALTLFLLGTFTRLNTPLAEWDHVSLHVAENWHKGLNMIWIFDHPPLYPAFLTILFLLLGPSIEVARLGNILCVLLAGCTLFQLGKILFRREAAVWAIVLYLINPVSIQGVISMDVADTSLLPLTFILIAYAITKNAFQPSPINTVFVAVSVCMSFWAKVTSSIVLVTTFLGCILIFILLKNQPNKKPWILNSYGIITGILGFLLSWVVISLFFWGKEACFTIFLAPGASLFSNHADADVFLRAAQIVRQMLIIMIWFSPFFIFSWLYSSWTLAIKANKNRRDVVLILIGVTLFYFIGYVLVGGTNWGYPRYHNAILPLLCLISGVLISNCMDEMKPGAFWIFIASLGIMVLILSLFTNDPLYFLILKMKEMLLSDSNLQEFIRLGLAIFVPLYGLPFAIGSSISYYDSKNLRKILVTCLVFGLFATILTLDIQQLWAPYRTTTEYGATGKTQVLAEVIKHIRPGESILTTPQFAYDLRNQSVSSSGFLTWQSQAQLLEYLYKKKPSVIIAGLTLNTYSQLEWLLRGSIQEELAGEYRFERIGSYFLWLRKKPDRYKP